MQRQRTELFLILESKTIMDQTYRNDLLFVIVIGFSITALHYLKSKKKPLRRREIHDVLMFSQMETSDLKQSKFSRSLIPLKMERLLSYLSLARYSLDICMYMVTNCDIAHQITKLHSKGVKVRFIVDADMAYASGSATKRIEKAGIELRWIKSTHMMHNKFCIIDASDGIENSDIIPFIMIGSLNWTSQALFNNWENVLVTSNTEIVNGLKEEFEKLWVQFKPIVKS